MTAISNRRKTRNDRECYNRTQGLLKEAEPAKRRSQAEAGNEEKRGTNGVPSLRLGTRRNEGKPRRF